MKEKGFTLIEILISIAIFAILILAIILFFQRSTETWVRSQPYLEAQEMARKAFYGEIGHQLGMTREIKAADTITALAASSIEFRRGIIDGGNKTCDTSSTDTSQEVEIFTSGTSLLAPGLTVIAPMGDSLPTAPYNSSPVGAIATNDDESVTIKYTLVGSDLIRQVQNSASGSAFWGDNDFDLSNNSITSSGIIATDVAGLNFSTDLPDTPTLTITINMGIDYKGDDAYEDIKTFSTTIRLPNI
ncbi:MAG: prepilin-type N-terminal cleavage/methylation domain-containing protein [Pseudomonadota bacterium]